MFWGGGMGVFPRTLHKLVITVYCVSKSYVLKYCPKFKANIQLA